MDTTSSGEHTIEVERLLHELDAGALLTLLDVRNAEDFARWRIESRRPFRVANVPYFDFLEEPEQALARVPRNLPVVVVCAKGGSSAWVVELLRENGREACHLEGGMAAYGEHLEAEAVSYAGAGRIALWQVNRRGKGCLSYVLRAGDEALVVDPSRDTDWYARFVEGLGARMVRVLDTHVHADHLSGGPALRDSFGIPYHAGLGSDASGAEPLHDGQRIELGHGPEGLALEVLATPGHTPGSVCFLLEERYLLSGDTLTVGAVGRPDLGGQAEAWGRALFHSLQRCIARLTDRTVVLPAHYGSADEIDEQGLVRGSFEELRRQPELSRLSEDDFVRLVAGAQAPAPEAYASLVRANRGLLDPSLDEVEHWELGRNQCASAVTRSAPRED